MGRSGIRIAVLTSSRADYGIYSPLLRELEKDEFFEMEILVFGTHLSEEYGNSYKEIENDNYKIGFTLETLPEGDTPGSISEAMSRVISGFRSIWDKNRYDLVFALGDRYEMFAAVASAVPYNIKIAHIHGGETTKGAIDNAFRHSISHMSFYHFAVCDHYAKRLFDMIGERNANIYNVGSLSIDNLKNMNFYSIDELILKYSLDFSHPVILMTFHPETVGYENNEKSAEELIEALKKVKAYNIVITMPNSDTGNRIIRDSLIAWEKADRRVKCIENLGSRAYLSCMKYCKMVLGNSSSGFIEASYFPVPVVNVGSRQEGRVRTPNIIDCDIDSDRIVESIALAETMGVQERTNIYGDGSAARKIISILKEIISK